MTIPFVLTVIFLAILSGSPGTAIALGISLFTTVVAVRHVVSAD